MTDSAENTFTELAIAADLGEIRRASDWLEKVCQAGVVPEEQISRLDLCLNEALANVISYGELDAVSAQIRLRFRGKSVGCAHEAELTVIDAGVPFDPLAHQQRPRPRSLAEVEPGGLGILMMRDAADDMGYRYATGHNQLTFRVRWTDPA